jgi:hypothetical protein
MKTEMKMKRDEERNKMWWARARRKVEYAGYEDGDEDEEGRTKK